MKPAGLHALKIAARDDLMKCIDDRGSIRQRCNSRGLESLLMLVLLRRMQYLPQVQRSLAGFMDRYQQRDTLNAFERGLLSNTLPTEYLGLERKKWIFTTYLALIHATPYLPPADITPILYTGQASWTCLTLCAIKIINTHGTGQAAAEQDRRFLLEQLENGSAREVWEGHLSAHLLGLLALHTFAPDSPLLTQGVHCLLDQRNADGGLPFIPHMTVYLTAFAGLALSKSSRRSAPVRRMADYLVSMQLPDGAWAYTENVRQSDIDSTCLAIECLQHVDPVGYAPAIRRGQAYLASMANPDGGFPTYLRHHPSEATMTANAIIVLQPAGATYGDVVQGAVGFLLHAQQEDGTFERSWSLSTTFAIARAAAALRRSGRCGEAVLSKSMTYLHRSQNPDGGWGQMAGQASDVISSAHALSALSHGEYSSNVQRGVAYLKKHQHSRRHLLADQAAPRPIPYQFPVLARIFVLNALADVAICASSHPPGDAGDTSLPRGRGKAAYSQSPRECHAP
jgi:squalene-hopene/tetraprenyl-beta-curcumene cyclase